MATKKKNSDKVEATKSEKKDDIIVEKKAPVDPKDDAGSIIYGESNKGTSEEKEALKSKKTAVSKKSQKPVDKKVVGYNFGRGTSFRKLKKQTSLSKLIDRTGIPVEATFQSEFILSDGSIYNQKDGLTSEKREEVLSEL